MARATFSGYGCGEGLIRHRRFWGSGKWEVASSMRSHIAVAVGSGATTVMPMSVKRSSTRKDSARLIKPALVAP